MTNDTSKTQQHSTELDASEFGNHVRQGGWRLGLLVARNVEKGERGGDTRSESATIARSCNEKVSALRFAELSGVGRNRVNRYLAAWNLAAEQGIVPMSWALTPGEDIDLDVDALPAWSQFYEKQNTTAQPPAPIPPSVEQVTEAVRSNPEYAKAVSEYVEPSREQVTKAMRSNPEIAEAAKSETFSQIREKSQAAPYVPREQQPSTDKDDVTTLLVLIRRASRTLDDAVSLAQSIDVAIPAIEAATSAVRMRCDAIDESAQSGPFDAAVVALMEEEA